MTTLNGLLPALTGNENIWIFQSNLPQYSIAKTVDALDVGDVGAWYAQDHLDVLRGGDLVLLWEEGQNAGLYAIGTLVGAPYEGEPVTEGGAPGKMDALAPGCHADPSSFGQRAARTWRPERIEALQPQGRGQHPGRS